MAEQQLHKCVFPNRRSSEPAVCEVSRKPRCQDRGSMGDMVEDSVHARIGVPFGDSRNLVQDLSTGDQEHPRRPCNGAPKTRTDGAHQAKRMDHDSNFGAHCFTMDRRVSICHHLLLVW